MPSIKLKLNFNGIIVEIEEDDYKGDIFNFLDELTDYMTENKEKISLFEFKSSGSPSFEQSPKTVKTITNSSESLSNNHNTTIQKLARDSKIDPNRLEFIFDFGTDDELPPILTSINKDARTEKQRIATILILYVNKILNNEDKISSHSLTPLLVKSNIDPTALSKAFRGNNSKYIRIEGKLYRITPQGILEAKRLLKDLNDSLGELY